MKSVYAIWDKACDIYTPSGEVFTAEQWMARYPIAKREDVTILCASGDMNGAFFGTLNQVKEMYEQQGCDFSDCQSDAAVVERFAEFEAAEQARIAEENANAVTTDERIAAALEAQVLMALPDAVEIV